MVEPAMMRKVVSLCLQWGSPEVESVQFAERHSLLDADLLVVGLQDPLELYASDHFLSDGLACLSPADSAGFLDFSSHWREEISGALRAGKLVVVWLSEKKTVHVTTDNYSGPASNYALLNDVAEFDVKNAVGKRMKLRPDVKFMTRYWRELGGVSRYEVYLRRTKLEPLITTEGGEEVVGALLRPDAGKGALVLLPVLDLVRGEASPGFWQRLLVAVLDLDAGLRGVEEVSPPSWTLDQRYRLPAEEEINGRILEARKRLESLTGDLEALDAQLLEETQTRLLLYGKGKPLERAVLAACRLLGFSATSLHDGESEFDCVLESEEGRIVCEVEGKDNTAVDVDKARQLLTNVQEDFEREGNNKYAKGALFANAYRTTAPEARGSYFTEKCMQTAQRNQFALVRTTDLFRVIQILKSRPDHAFARACRAALFNTSGTVVVFPDVGPTASSV
jgi:hypothetical protein